MIAPTVLHIVEITSFPEGHNNHIEVTEGKCTVMAILTTRGGGGGGEGRRSSEGRENHVSSNRLDFIKGAFASPMLNASKTKKHN